MGKSLQIIYRWITSSHRRCWKTRGHPININIWAFFRRISSALLLKAAMETWVRWKPQFRKRVLAACSGFKQLRKQGKPQNPFVDKQFADQTRHFRDFQGISIPPCCGGSHWAQLRFPQTGQPWYPWISTRRHVQSHGFPKCPAGTIFARPFRESLCQGATHKQSLPLASGGCRCLQCHGRQRPGHIDGRGGSNPLQYLDQCDCLCMNYIASLPHSCDADM